jgi:hypothetical protein
MSQEDVLAVGRAGHQPAAQAYCQITPPDEMVTGDKCESNYRSLPTGGTNASEAVSAVSNQGLQSERFETVLSKAGLAEIPKIRVPSRDEMWVSWESQESPGGRVAFRAGALLAVLGIGFLGGSTFYGLLEHVGREREQSGKHAIATVVERIIEAESNGCPNLKNKRSTATGAGQFLNETWIRLIRTHRPDIARRSEERCWNCAEIPN